MGTEQQPANQSTAIELRKQELEEKRFVAAQWKFYVLILSAAISSVWGYISIKRGEQIRADHEVRRKVLDSVIDKYLVHHDAPKQELKIVKFVAETTSDGKLKSWADDEVTKLEQAIVEIDGLLSESNSLGSKIIELEKEKADLEKKQKDYSKQEEEIKKLQSEQSEKQAKIIKLQSTAVEWSAMGPADKFHCSGEQLDQGYLELNEAKKLAEKIGATCLMYQPPQKYYGAFTGRREPGCSGCTAGITHTLQVIMPGQTARKLLDANSQNENTTTGDSTTGSSN